MRPTDSIVYGCPCGRDYDVLDDLIAHGERCETVAENDIWSRLTRAAMDAEGKARLAVQRLLHAFEDASWGVTA